MRNLVRKITPQFLLSWYRSSKKKKRNQELAHNKAEGKIYTVADLTKEFQAIGIVKDDVLLVHSSLSKIGYVEEGPKTVISALLNVIGERGNLLMPNSPNASLQLEYIKELEEFDVENTPSSLGAISEYFRNLPQAKRSAHPTEPVSCIGPEVDYFVGEHFGELTPYTTKSPFYRVSERGGKILYLGVTLDNAGTNLHTLEDAVEDFRFPVYYSDTFEVNVKFSDGTIKPMRTKVHNPEQSAKRRCDELIPLFIEKGVMQDVQIGEARALLVDAKRMLECMIEEYKSLGVTMYTPHGVHH